jgi:hypothetical protein
MGWTFIGSAPWVGCRITTACWFSHLPTAGSGPGGYSMVSNAVSPGDCSSCIRKYVGVVPMHPSDKTGKTPLNLNQAFIPCSQRQSVNRSPSALGKMVRDEKYSRCTTHSGHSHINFTCPRKSHHHPASLPVRETPSAAALLSSTMPRTPVYNHAGQHRRFSASRPGQSELLVRMRLSLANIGRHCGNASTARAGNIRPPRSSSPPPRPSAAPPVPHTNSVGSSGGSGLRGRASVVVDWK